MTTFTLLKAKQILIYNLFCFLLLFISTNSFSQTAPPIQWQKCLGGSSTEFASCVRQTNDGGYIIAGYSGSNDGNVSGNHGGVDYWIVKLNNLGSVQWQKSLGGSEEDEANSIQQTTDGGYIVAGVSYSNDSNVNGHHGSTSTADYWIVKLNSAGNIQWQKSLGGSGEDYANCIQQTNDGGYIVAGYSWSTDGDVTGNHGDDDYWIVKLNNSGSIQWQKCLGGSNQDYANSIQQTTDGGYIVAGFASSNDGDVSNNHGYGDYWITKLNGSGSIQWQKCLGGSSVDIAYSVEQTTDGDYIVAGASSSNDGDVSVNKGDYDYWIVKLNSSGNIQWQNDLGGSNIETAYSIQQTKDGEYIVAGESYSNDGDVSGNHGDIDYWITKLNSNGDIKWKKCLGGSNKDAANFIQQTTDEGYIIAGWSASDEGDVSGNNDQNYENYWIVKLYAEGTYVQPKIYTSSSSLSAGQTQMITGSGFTNNGTIDLYIKNSQGDIIANNNSFTYLSSGGFSYQLPITSAMPGGEYQAYATDVTTGVTTATIKFLVNNATAQQKLWITQPISSSTYQVGQAVTITWGDNITSSKVNGKTGLVTKRYKIEYSDDNGSTWVIISNAFIKDVPANQINYFTTSYTFSNGGNYKIRVTDLDNTTDFNYSSSFNITATIIGGFTSSLEWDESSPVPAFVDHPVGLAADGVSRILVKLSRNTGITTPVQSVSAQISASSDNSSGPTMLGKIKLALQSVDSYSMEGNAANSTSTSYTYPSLNTNQAIYFWLVAPDDFTQQANSQAAERTIKVTCTITYNDNTTEIKTIDNIRIVRPPLMAVHGINGSPASFDNMKYNVDGTTRLFKYSGGEDGLFKVYYPVDLPSYSSFSDNAQNLLAESGSNSFQYVLNQLHYLGFAANRVDYVAHSMGGSLARTIINEFHRQYSPQPGDPRKFQNYDSGFIHKLITLNTPHNGSPLADFVEDLFGNSLELPSFIEANNLGGFFVKSSPGLFINTYVPSDAIRDLQAVNGGIRFKETFVKNHLIGGDMDRYNVPDADLLASLNGDPQTKLILSLCNILLPDATEGADGIIDALNAYVSLNYGYPNFLSNSDAVVPVSSEFASSLSNFNEDQIPEVENTSAVSTETNSFGVDRNHLLITDDLAIGTEVMRLLNSPANSGFFANSIAANPNPGGTTYKTNSIQGSDSSINYIDTSYIQITNPQSSNVVVDSTLNIAIHVSDTTNLQKIQLVFQGQYYESISKVTDQVFNVQVLPNEIGKLTIVANGVYDSLGYIVNHTDTFTVQVVAADTLKGFYITPKAQNLNPHQVFNPVCNAVYSSYIGVLTQDNNSLSFSIADPNVVKYIDSLHEFVAQDTGTTYIVFNYKGFADTGYIYITLTAPQTVLAVTLNSFNISSNECKTVTLNWKTSAETNSYGFDIEQSKDGVHFTKVAFIKSKGNSGFNYNYSVDSLQQGQYYYRLKQIDFDGQYKYSSVETINLNCTNRNIISLYPNPAINKITLVSSERGEADIRLMDSHGKTIKTLKANFISGSTQDIPVSNLSAGVYFVQVKIGDEVENLKFVKN